MIIVAWYVGRQVPVDARDCVDEYKCCKKQIGPRSLIVDSKGMLVGAYLLGLSDDLKASLCVSYKLSSMNRPSERPLAAPVTWLESCLARWVVGSWYVGTLVC